MTRLYTEADVRAMLVRAFVGGHAAHADEPLPTYRLDDAAGYLASSILSTATPVAAPDLSRLAEAVRDRDVVALARIEACTSCEETFTMAEQAAFDPNDNDHCPECGERGTLTTYYGDPQWRIREGDLGIHTRAEDGRFVAEFLDLAPIIAGTGLVGDPRLGSCGDCRHGEGSSCFHPDAPTTPDLGMPLLRTATPPPLECPLRTPGKEQKR